MALETNIPYTVSSLSGYTCDLTPFTFVPDTGSQYSNDRVLWDFGDGTTSYEVSAVHVYRWPGTYEVSLVCYNSAGDTFASTQKTTISAVNFIDEKLEIANYDLTNINIPAGLASDFPIVINRYNSWQSYPNVSADGYSLTLYASGSNARRLNIESYLKNKWAHLDDIWYFYTKTVYDNGTVDRVPVEQVKTTTTLLYYKKDGNDYIRCDETDEGAVLVGTSGSAEFYYSDTKPKVRSSIDTPVFVYISVDTTKFPDKEQVILGRHNLYPSLEVLQHQKLVLPVKLRFNEALNLVFTSCGILEMPISQNKWQYNEIPFVLGMQDRDGNLTRSYDPLSANFVDPAVGDYQVANIGLYNSTGQRLSADFFFDSNPDLPANITSTYRGYFIPYESCENAVLCASVTVFEPFHYTKDLSYGYIFGTNVDNHIRLSPILGSIFSNGSFQKQFKLVQSEFKAEWNYAGISSVSFAPNKDVYDNGGIVYSVLGAPANLVYKLHENGETYILDDGRYANVAEMNTAQNATIGFDGSVYVLDNPYCWKWDGLNSYVDGIASRPTNPVVYSGWTGAGTATHIDVDKDGYVYIAVKDDYSNLPGLYKYDNVGLTPAVVVGTNYADAIDATDMDPIDIFINGGNIYSVLKYRIGTRPVLYTDSVDVDIEILTNGQVKINFNSTTLDVFNLHLKNSVVKFSGSEFDAFLLSDTYIIDSFDNTSLTIEPYYAIWVELPALTASYGTNILGTVEFLQGDRLVKLTSDLEVDWVIENLYNPVQMSVDKYDLPYVAQYYNRVTKFEYFSQDSGGPILTNYEFVNHTNAVDYYGELNPQMGGVVGLTFDLGDNLWALSNADNTLYLRNVDIPSLSGALVFDSTLSNAYNCNGDWNGWRWYNKYDVRKYIDYNSGTFWYIKNLIGSTTFDILPAVAPYSIAKINETFDAQETLKSYRFQERLYDFNNFFDNFLGTIVGNVSSSPETLGKTIYEKIANFVRNNNDVDTCNIDALYSLCEQYNVDIDQYRYSFPPSMRRLMDILSIQHKRLWGERSKFNRNFNKKGNYNNSFYGRNLGSPISNLTYKVSAGQSIVAYQLFNSEYRLIQPFIVNSLSAYPLSAYNSSWNWGLEPGINGTDIFKYYNFFEFTGTYSNSQLEGIFDWDNTINHTLVEANSGINDWTIDNGIIDKIIDYELRNKIELF